ncbi:hypothetical protein EVAR_11763_1 [Eumeta japonica]|uniref:Uncharacterized protein n=1 Tax=Eumeta variegata TaxID=151549 RepID=A0A4C1UPA2_EUMVA|nr:hypothetical protein EVAR_11763_1 [Eumeta japonica]
MTRILCASLRDLVSEENALKSQCGFPSKSYSDLSGMRECVVEMQIQTRGNTKVILSITGPGGGYAVAGAGDVPRRTGFMSSKIVLMSSVNVMFNKTSVQLENYVKSSPLLEFRAFHKAQRGSAVAKSSCQ